MSDPLSFVPLALAAAGGRVDGFDVRQLVAAGVTLLQRTAPLVRALQGRRAAVLLPASAHVVTALSASAGRGAVLLPLWFQGADIASQLRDADVGAVFTLRQYEPLVPAEFARVLLDDAPAWARWSLADRFRDVDLTSHDALAIEGEKDVAGAQEEAALVFAPSSLSAVSARSLSHRELMHSARHLAQGAQLTSHDAVLNTLPLTTGIGLQVGLLAPLLAGAAVSCAELASADEVLRQLEEGETSVLVGPLSLFTELVALLERRITPLRPPALRLALSGPVRRAGDLAERWHRLTGVALRSATGA
ncbi:MAG: AMP-binding protein [Gemmatimonadaceae bacterium]